MICFVVAPGQGTHREADEDAPVNLWRTSGRGGVSVIVKWQEQASKGQSRRLTAPESNVGAEEESLLLQMHPKEVVSDGTVAFIYK